MLSYDLAVDILNVLKTAKDPDVQKESLELFLYVLQSPNIKEFFVNPNSYSLKVLLCYVKCSEPALQDLAVDIFYKISEFRYTGLEQRLIEDDILIELFKLIMVRIT